MTIDQNSFDSNIGACHTDNGAVADHAADLSRQAWGAPGGGSAAQDKSQNIVFTDQQGRITEVDHPDGEIYNYDNFQPNGQPGQIRITDSKSGDWGQWKREEDGLWRAYHKDKPDYEVVRGEWLVDDKGMMHMQGVQSTKELPPVITKDAEGHITKVSRDDGITYQYSKFDANGQPEVCKITDKKSHDWGYWKKEGDHLWRSYDKEKPNFEVLRGDWTVDKNGVMQMNGVQDSLPKPVLPHHEHNHKAAAENFKIGPGPLWSATFFTRRISSFKRPGLTGSGG